jgi:hypothetical protein
MDCIECGGEAAQECEVCAEWLCDDCACQSADGRILCPSCVEEAQLDRDEEDLATLDLLGDGELDGELF